MTKREKYLAAAKFVSENPTGCCAALYTKMGSNKFLEYFKPDDETNMRYNNYILTSFWFGRRDEPQNQLARSLALLFMAELDK